MIAIEKLPHYIECPDCELRHFLAINRDSRGNWTAGYVAYAEDGERALLGINNCETLDEIAHRLNVRLKRHNFI